MRFDQQARQFDQRAGFPQKIARQISRAVLDMARIDPGQILLEIGAGTGEIGCHLAVESVYIGLDSSGPMLDVFRSRLPNCRSTTLLLADAALSWPVRAGVVDAVFSSRTLHLFEPEHLARELARVSNPRGVRWIWGRVLRDKNSVRETMRRKMRELIGESGFPAPGGSEGRRMDWIPELERLGAKPIEQRIAGEWTVETAPMQSLRSWEGKPGLAGLDIPDSVKSEVLAELSAWMESYFPSPERPRPAIERYVLSGMEMAAKADTP